MSHWQELGIQAKIDAILADALTHDPHHHFGRPFLTAYQLAIEFERRHPEDVAVLDLPIGGAGTGQRNSLAQYLAGSLSEDLAENRIDHIEGAHISHQHLNDISFKRGEGTLR